jgi:TPR repeat protein
VAARYARFDERWLGEYHSSGEGGVARNPAEARRLISDTAYSGQASAIDHLATLK